MPWSADLAARNRQDSTSTHNQSRRRRRRTSCPPPPRSNEFLRQGSENVNRVELEPRQPRFRLAEGVDAKRPTDQRCEANLHARPEHVEHIKTMLRDVRPLSHF